MTLIARNIEKRFRDRVLFSDVSFTVGPGRKVTLIGANGSGKTTLLNIIAGIEEFDSGKIELPIKKFRLGIMNQFYETDEDTILLDDAIADVLIIFSAFLKTKIKFLFQTMSA